jgi:alpha-tubulin suppressor-like RCC1 family protein
MFRFLKPGIILTLVAALTISILAVQPEQRSTEGALGAGAPESPASVSNITNVTESAPRRAQVVDPEVLEQLTYQDMVTALVSLAGPFTGTDDQQMAQIGAATSQLLSTLPANSYAEVRETGVLPLAIMKVSADAVDVLRTSPLVRAVEANELVTVASDSARIRDGSAASNIANLKGDNTVVAVIDSGIQTNHPFLMQGATKKVIAEACFTTPGSGTNGGGAYSFASPCPNATPMTTTSAAVANSAGPCTYVDAAGGCKHGTHIAGVIAGEPGQLTGYPEISGVAPNTKLISIQVFGQFVQGSNSGVSANTVDVVTALGWLYKQRATYPTLSAVNVSIASADPNKKYAGDCSATETAYFDAVQLLKSAGIATIASAGNSGWNDGVSPPACLSNTIGVGSIDDVTGQRSSFSNISATLELLAPGSVIASAWPGSIAGIESGTSQSAPAVAGAWALMRQKYPNSGTAPKTVAQILSLLQNSGTNVTTTVATPVSATYTIARVNIGRALGVPSPSRVAIGGNFSCTAGSDGTVSCAGGNASGQLGISPATKASSTVPLRIASTGTNGLTGVKDVAAGDAFACANLGSSLRCWGSNANGQLGIGTTSAAASPTPTLVKTSSTATLGTGSPVTAISAKGSSACAVTGGGAAGIARCWGANSSGQLGDGTTTQRPYADRKVKKNVSTDLVGITDISMGATSACALLSTGAVSCWGANADGQLGNNSVTASSYAVPVSGINGTTVKAKSVSVGTGFACALLTTGAVKCWGRNTYGQLGNNTATGSRVPVDVKTATQSSVTATTPLAFTGVTAISAGAQHTCAIAVVSGNSQGFCWGYNSDRQLGVGTTTPTPPNRWFAAAVFGTKTTGATALATGPNNTSFVVTNAMVSLGGNSSGQLGMNNTTTLNPATWSLRF